MSRFIKGLKFEIQNLLINETYNHISHLFCLARKAKKQILLSCMNDVIDDDKYLPNFHVHEEQEIVEHATDLPSHKLFCMLNPVTRKSCVIIPLLFHDHN
jgi:hypothetical protein